MKITHLNIDAESISSGTGIMLFFLLCSRFSDLKQQTDEIPLEIADNN